MKVKEIVYEDNPLPGQGVPGKVTKVTPPMGDKPGSVSVTMPNGISSEIPSNMIVKGPDGKPTANTQTSNTANSASPDQQIQPGTDLKVQEEPGAEVPYYVQPGPQPMAKTGGRGNTPIVASKLWTAITPDVEARAHSQGFRKVMLQYNNKQFPGLEGGDPTTGSKIIVAPSDFQSMSTPGAENMRRGMGMQSAEKTGIGAPMRESDAELARWKNIAGL